MNAAKGSAPAGGTARGAGGEQHGQVLDFEYSTEDAFRTAWVRAHIIGFHPKGPERKRAILRFLQALKAALATEARP